MLRLVFTLLFLIRLCLRVWVVNSAILAVWGNAFKHAPFPILLWSATHLT